MKKYRTVVNGASFLGLAFASCDPDNTLIIERGNILGCDMYSSLRIDHLSGFEIKEELTKNLSDRILMNKHMVHDDMIIMSEIMPVLGKFVEEHNLKIMFDCVILKQTETKNGYLIEAICRDQIMMFESEYYIDTLSDQLTDNLSCNILVKANGNNPINVTNSKHYDLGKGIYCLEIPVTSLSMSDVRREVLAVFKKPIESEDTLLMIAEEVCVRGNYRVNRTGNHIKACSGHTDNLFDAMDKGIELWRNL